jgi:Protein of unknown function (DUF3551)
MWRTLLISVGCFVLAAMPGAGAQTQNDQQQWCAYFSGGPTNCTFATFAQCLEAIRGKTALCQENIPPAGSNSGAGRRRRPADR